MNGSIFVSTTQLPLLWHKEISSAKLKTTYAVLRTYGKQTDSVPTAETNTCEAHALRCRPEHPNIIRRQLMPPLRLNV
jgi:hypothetical protein